jgi:hypothetical protein
VLLQARKAMIDLNNNSKFEQLSFVQEHEENSQPKKTKHYSEVIDMILEININTLSPLDALIQLEKLQKQVKK